MELRVGGDERRGHRGNAGAAGPGAPQEPKGALLPGPASGTCQGARWPGSSRRDLTSAPGPGPAAWAPGPLDTPPTAAHLPASRVPSRATAGRWSLPGRVLTRARRPESHALPGGQMTAMPTPTPASLQVGSAASLCCTGSLSVKSIIQPERLGHQGQRLGPHLAAERPWLLARSHSPRALGT